MSIDFGHDTEGVLIVIRLFGRMLRGNKGEAAAEVIFFAAVVVFVIFPVASAVAEKYIAVLKGQVIKDAVDVANIALYNSLDAGRGGTAEADFGGAAAMELYKSFLAENLSLNPDLSPKADSVAEGTVVIDELYVYTSGFPLQCPRGKLVIRPAVHAVVTVPVRPSLYRGVVLGLMGKDYVELKVHVDTDLPVDK